MHSKLNNGILLGLVSVFSVLILWASVGMTKIYQNYDGPYYIVVAKSWYNKVVIGENFSFPLPQEYYTAHFPLYPAAITAVSKLGFNYLQSMVAVNLIAGTIFVVAFYLILEKFKIKHAVWVAGSVLFFWPRMWAVRSVGGPETLFLLWIVLSLFCFSQKKYGFAAVTGALAVATKSPGILLSVAYFLWWVTETVKNRRIEWRVWPIVLIPLVLLGIFSFFQAQTGDFWAYFHSGDNIHLQNLPFQVFNSSQPWVGNWWLEDIVWVYVISAIGVVGAFRKNKVWGWFGAVFLLAIMYVSHRDISRYGLPLVPVVLLGLSEVWERKEVRWVMLAALVPIYFYSVNFLTHNVMAIGDWAPLL